MLRRLPSILLWLAFLGVQVGWLSALPTPWSGFPLLLLAGLFFITRQSTSTGVWWLCASGVAIDLFHLGIGPLDTTAYMATAAVAAGAARSWFTNRSLYASVGVTLAGWIAFAATHVLLQGAARLLDLSIVPWDAVVYGLAVTGVWLLLGTSALFFFGKRIVSKLLA